MRATFKLLNSYFWKTVYGPIIAFVLPVLLLLILGNIMRVQYVYPGIIAMSIMFIGIMALPLSIMELKSSSLFKYIGASPVDNKKFSIVAIGYYVFIALLTVFIILCATMAFSKMHLFNAGDVVFGSGGFKYGILGGIFYTFKGIGSFLFATLLHLFMVIAFGLAIATFAKTPQQALTISIIIIIPSMFLSGMILSVDIIAQSTAMQWISRLIPFRYTTGNIVVASTPIDQLGDVFALLTPKEKTIIFDAVDQNGEIHYFRDHALTQSVTIKNIDDLWREKQMSGGWENMTGFVADNNGNPIPLLNGVVKEHTLFKLVFVDVQKGALSGSDNNIFAWGEAWGVRRIPEVDQIKEFITSYFIGNKSDSSRFSTIWSYIQNGDYDWLNLFLKQNNVLYTIADRVCNTGVPVILSAGALYYVSKNFKWSAR